MLRLIWYFGVMGVWTVATMLPSKLLRRTGNRKAEGVLMMLWFLGLAVLTALLFTAYLRGWRAPYENFSRVRQE
jgi:hypothetical protein